MKKISYRNRKYIADQIIKRREEDGVSVSELSRRSGVSRPTINKIERGEVGQVSELLAVANAIGLDISLE